MRGAASRSSREAGLQLDSKDTAVNPLTPEDSKLSSVRPTTTAAKTDATKKPEEPKKKEYPDFKVTGFFQLDSAFFAQSGESRTTLGDINDGLGFRRARIAATGNVTEHTTYMMEFDLAQAQARFVDVWGQFDVRPNSHLRIGRFRQPFGMTELTSIRELPTLERPSMFALAPFRQTGIMYYGNTTDEVATWAFSGYRTLSDNYGNVFAENGGYGTAERITWLPWDNGDCGLFHIGIDHAYLDPGRNVLQYVSQDEVFVGQQPNLGPSGLSVFPIEFVPPFVNSGVFQTNSANLFNVESALSLGRTVVQSEMRWSNVQTPTGIATVPAAYLHIRHVLTGEIIPYNRKAGVFTRIKPANPVAMCSPMRGAWEAIGQVSYINLNPLLDVGAPGAGRRMLNSVVGLNWYVQNNAKVQWAWINTELNDRTLGNSVSNAFAMRLQMDY